MRQMRITIDVTLDEKHLSENGVTTDRDILDCLQLSGDEALEMLHISARFPNRENYEYAGKIFDRDDISVTKEIRYKP